MLTILYGLSSAITWGAADFTGGLASRKSRAYQAALLGESCGLTILLIASSFINEAPLTWQNLVFCSLGGVMGVIGLLLFFHALEKGQMSVAAPVSALTAALVPVVIGSLLDGFPGLVTFSGFALALVSIWFISYSDSGSKKLHMRLNDLAIPLIAGVSFGFYLALVNLGSQESMFWSLTASRAAATIFMLLFVLVSRKKILPPAKAWPYFILNGALDITGNGLYILAGQVGRMDVAAVLASLYPASTVLLAWFILRERLNRYQFFGILLALAAVVLMTI